MIVEGEIVDLLSHQVVVQNYYVILESFEFLMNHLTHISFKWDEKKISVAFTYHSQYVLF